MCLLQTETDHMTVQTLYTAATGMEALETKLDVIANNMANINTTGFKKDRANFEDMFYRQYRLPGARTPTAIARRPASKSAWARAFPARNRTTSKARSRRRTISSTSRSKATGSFRCRTRTADFYYTRAGNFGLNANGQIVLGSANNGYLLEPTITIPPEATDIVVSADGQVQIRTQDSTNLQTLGQLQLAKFVNPDGLLKLGDNLYQKTDASGDANARQPGPAGLRQHSAGLFGSVERRAGDRADRSDHDAAGVRAEFAGRAGRRPDHADRGQPAAARVTHR